MDPLNVVDEIHPNKRRRLFGTVNDTDDKSSNTKHHVPVRTVYVGVFGVDMVDQVKGHFERFGEIESVSMRLEGYWKHCCLVQFKREEDAAKALQCTETPWLYYEAKPANPWHQPDHPLNMPPDSESNIVATLNDDCIQEIFRRLKLLADLTNVAEVCVRFNQQAKITFASTHKHLEFRRESLARQDLIEKAMKHFGKNIRSLSTSWKRFTTEANAIDTIGRRCGPNLKQLELSGFRFQHDLQALRPIFAGIEQLKLVRCGDSIGLGGLMAGCVELKSLKLIHYEDLEFKTEQYLMEQTFPKLEKFSLRCNKLNEKTFERFVTRHPALTKLSVKRSIPSYAFRVFGEYAKNLQELNFESDLFENDDQFRQNAAFVGQLVSLKKLRLDTDAHGTVPVLNALIAGGVPIECLDIWFRSELGDDGGDAIKCICQLKQIETLRFRTYHRARHVTDADIIELAKHLPELEELDMENYGHSDVSQVSTIGLRKMLVYATNLKMLKLRWIGSIKIDIDDYKLMLSTVQKRKEKVPLVIEIHGKADQVDVPAAVLAENRKILNIKVIR